MQFQDWPAFKKLINKNKNTNEYQLVGYKDEVVQESFLEVFHNGVLSDLGQQDHVIHSALLYILTLPVVLSLNQTPER